MESDDEMLRQISEAEAQGYRVEVHAIGKLDGAAVPK